MELPEKKLPNWMTIKQLSQEVPAFSEASIRWIRFTAKKRGMSEAFVRFGKRVYVDCEKFFTLLQEWEEKNKEKENEE